MITNNLLVLAKAYATHKNLSLSTVSTYAANAGRFMANIEDGKSCTLRTYQRVVVWFAANWPADLEWPKGVERPKVEAKRGAA